MSEKYKKKMLSFLNSNFLFVDRKQNEAIFQLYNKVCHSAEPRSSVGNVADLRAGGRCFGSRLGQYPFRGLMIVTATGFITLSPRSIVSTMVVWESSQWLGKNIVRSTGKKNSRKA